jgi:hypothetical protein
MAADTYRQEESRLPAQMKEIGRTKRVRLGGFTRTSLEEQADRRGVGVSVLLRQAIVYYSADRGSGRRGWRLPRFASCDSTSGARAIDVELSDQDWETLADEATFQDADEDRLLQHLSLYYLADLEAGRVAERILRAIEDPPEESE